jgi:hypothetical protein
MRAVANTFERKQQRARSLRHKAQQRFIIVVYTCIMLGTSTRFDIAADTAAATAILAEIRKAP